MEFKEELNNNDERVRRNEVYIQLQVQLELVRKQFVLITVFTLSKDQLADNMAKYKAKAKKLADQT